MVGGLDRRTVVAVGVAILAAAAYGLDPRAPADRPAVQATPSGALPILPEAVRARLGEASVTLEGPAGPAVSVSFDGGDRVVRRGDAVVGPADPAAVEGLLEDLRQTRVRRRIGDGDVGAVDGAVVVAVPGAAPVRIEIGRRLADGGRAARLADGRAVAIDPFLDPYLPPRAETFVLRRLLPVDPRAVTRLEVGGTTLRRDETGAWVEAPGTAPLRVSDAAALAAVERVTAAPLSDLAPAKGRITPSSAVARVRVETAGGRTYEVLAEGRGCGEAALRADRGPGYQGCVARAVFDPLDPVRLFDRRLLPIPYGRIVRVEVPGSDLHIARRPGGWAARRDDGDEVWEQPLAEPRVFAYLDGLAAVRLDPTRPVAPKAPAARVRFVADDGATLEIACGPSWCRRDGEPAFALIGRPPDPFVPDPARLRSERLISFRPEHVVGLAVRGTDPAFVPQAVLEDGGGLVLRAPADHPFPADAADPLRVEAMVSLLAGLRGPQTGTAGAPKRTFTVELLDGRTVRVDLFEPCVAAAGGEAVALDAGACTTLERTLLYADPARDLLRRADAVTVRRGGRPPVRLLRAGAGGAGEADTGRWRPADPAAPVEAALAALDEAAAFRSDALVAGTPPSPPALVLEADLAGRTVRMEVGPRGAWARFAGTAWYYAAGAAEGAAP